MYKMKALNVKTVWHGAVVGVLLGALGVLIVSTQAYRQSTSGASTATAPEMTIYSPDWQFHTLPGGGHHVYRIGDGDNMIEIYNSGGGVLEWEAYVASETCSNPIPDSWLKLEESQGETTPDEPSYLFFDPHSARDEDFELGDYNLLFCITSNDPAQPLATANLRLSVVEPQDMPMAYLELQYPGIDEFEAGTTTQLQAVKHVFSGHTFDVNDETIWSSSDESVATIDTDGLMTAVSPGEAIMKAEYQGRSDVLYITVTEPSAPEQPEPPHTWQQVKERLVSILRNLLSRFR